MKGIIFNLVEEVVQRAHGEDVWDDILERAGLSGAYSSLGSYPDADLMQLVGAASSLLEVPADDVVRFIGEGAIPLLADRYPAFFEHPSTRPFLLTLNDIIHPEVLKLYPGADVPVFDFEVRGDDELLIGYKSARKMCALAEGFILGAAGVYREAVTIEQPQCMHRGADACLIHCRFAPLDA
jgi:hypothetical protein